MIQITEDDVLGADKKQIVISNDAIKVIIVPEVGGRVAEIRYGETTFLYRTYPKGVAFGPYTEYGGIEECIGSAPGNLWNANWLYEIKENGVLLQVMSRSVLVRKFMTLDESLPVVKIKYDFFHTGNTMTKFTFGVHPEISIGGVFNNNRYYIPSKDGAIQGVGESAGFKKSVPTPESWCSVSNGKYAFGQMFPKDVIDSIEVYYPRVDTHLVIQPMILGVGIAPDMRSSFTYMIYAGEGDEMKVAEIRQLLDNEFSVEYEQFNKDEIPEEVLKTGITAPGPTMPGLEVGPFQIVDVPKGMLHTINMPNLPPDINELIKANMGKAKYAMKEAQEAQRRVQMEMAKEVQKAMKEAKEMQKQAQRQIQAEMVGKSFNLQRNEQTNIVASKIEINHVNGNISINDWNEDHIGYEMSGNVKSGGDVARFDTNGDLSLNIPQSVTDINLKMVNGHVAINDISANLFITGVSGEIDAKMGKLAEDNFVEISLVNGNINLMLRRNSWEDSACTIEAGTVNGEVSTDLPTIEEERRMPNYIKGKLGDGSAKILLKAVSGNININGYMSVGN